MYIEECYLKHILFAVSKYLTLLIEIHPINNVRVLKAVDSCVRVQVKYSANLKISLFNLLCWRENMFSAEVSLVILEVLQR